MKKQDISSLDQQVGTEYVEKVEAFSEAGFEVNAAESQYAKQLSLEYSRTSMSRVLNSQKEAFEVSSS